MNFPAYDEMLDIARTRIKVYPKRYLLTAALHHLVVDKVSMAKDGLTVAKMCARDFNGHTVPDTDKEAYLEALITQHMAMAAKFSIEGDITRAEASWEFVQHRLSYLAGYRDAKSETEE